MQGEDNDVHDDAVRPGCQRLTKRKKKKNRRGRYIKEKSSEQVVITLESVAAALDGRLGKNERTVTKSSLYHQFSRKYNHRK